MEKRSWQAFYTDKAPKAIGTYSQATKAGDLVFISGQIPLAPETMEIIEGDFRAQAQQTLTNLMAVAKASGGNLDHIVKLTVYLTDFTNFPILNEVMSEYFTKPYPARAAIGVSVLPKDVMVEIEAVMYLA